MTDIDELRYPIGRFDSKQDVTPGKISEWISIIAKAPADYRDAVKGLDDAKLDTRYRPEGWTLRQVVHHVADSHINSYVRFKLALTEDAPVIRPYHEELWAELPEAKSAPAALSLELIDALHRRWSAVLNGMSSSDFDRTFRHPALGEMTLGIVTGVYAWHTEHHLAHITNTRRQKGWL